MPVVPPSPFRAKALSALAEGAGGALVAPPKQKYCPSCGAAAKAFPGGWRCGSPPCEWSLLGADPAGAVAAKNYSRKEFPNHAPGEGRWITLKNGTHVHLDETGDVDKGPPALEGGPPSGGRRGPDPAPPRVAASPFDRDPGQGGAATAEAPRPRKGSQRNKRPGAGKKTTPRGEGPFGGLDVSHYASDPEFARKIEGALGTIPKHVLAKVAAAGYRVATGQLLSEVLPDTVGEHPRGWPPGSTWDEVEGCATEGTIALASHHTSGGGDGELRPNRRMEGVLRHEVGHAVDAAYGNVSRGEAFQKAYQEDVAALGWWGRRRNGYYLQPPPEVGAHEAFAETFGALQGGGGDGTTILKRFPNCAKFVQQLTREEAP